MKKKSALDKLDTLIGKTAKGQAHVHQSSLLKKNLDLFKRISPSIYQDYVQYQPQHFKLSNTESQTNMIHMLSRSKIYQKDAVAYAKKEVVTFIKSPQRLFIQSRQSDNIYFKQQEITNTLQQRFNTNQAPLNDDISLPIGFFYISGIGLGYHIEELVRQLNIRHLCLFEPYQDIFYASLHCIDWENIVCPFIEPGRSINFFIAKDSHTNISNLQGLAAYYGLHHLVNAYLYEHNQNEENNEFKAKLQSNLTYILRGAGFFEDERLSLAHSLKNIRHTEGIVTQSLDNIDNTPVFIIGNGPSLDNLVDVLKQYQNKALIISCGTALGSLLKCDIKPHIHIEMERTKVTLDALKAGSLKEYRQEITLVALNNVHPDVFKQFKDHLLVLKNNDAGSELIYRLIDRQIPGLDFCNPTVGNTAFNLSCFLGFKHIYLFGMDFGMKDSERHHAQASPHYDKDNQLFQTLKQQDAKFTLKGNLSEQVYTTGVLRQAVEKISHCIKHFNYPSVYNLNDGAYIEYTTALTVDAFSKALSNMPDINAANILRQIKHKTAKPESNIIDGKQIKSHYLKGAISLMNDINFSHDIKNLDDVTSELDRWHQTIANMQQTDKVSFHLLIGTHMTFSFLIYQCCFARDVNIQSTYQLASELYINFISYCHNLLVNHLEDLDRGGL